MNYKNKLLTKKSDFITKLILLWQKTSANGKSLKGWTILPYKGLF